MRPLDLAAVERDGRNRVRAGRAEPFRPGAVVQPDRDLHQLAAQLVRVQRDAQVEREVPAACLRAGRLAGADGVQQHGRAARQRQRQTGGQRDGCERRRVEPRRGQLLEESGADPAVDALAGRTARCGSAAHELAGRLPRRLFRTLFVGRRKADVEFLGDAEPPRRVGRQQRLDARRCVFDDAARGDDRAGDEFAGRIAHGRASGVARDTERRRDVLDRHPPRPIGAPCVIASFLTRSARRGRSSRRSAARYRSGRARRRARRRSG